VVAYELWGVAGWGGGMSASCKPRVQLLDTGSGWPHSALWYH